MIDKPAIAQEAGDLLISGFLPNLMRRANLQDFSRAHDCHPIGDSECLVVVVCDKDRGRTRCAQHVSNIDRQPLAQVAIKG